MRSAVGVRACFANVFATKLVINRQEGRTGTKRERGGFRTRARFGSKVGAAIQVRRALASEFARVNPARLSRGKAVWYRAVMRVKVASRGIEMIFARGTRQMKREFWKVGWTKRRGRAERRPRALKARWKTGRVALLTRNRRAVRRICKQSRGICKAIHAAGFRKERVRRTLPPSGNATPRSGITASPASPVWFRNSLACFHSQYVELIQYPANTIFFVTAHSCTFFFFCETKNWTVIAIVLSVSRIFQMYFFFFFNKIIGPMIIYYLLNFRDYASLHLI